MMTSCAARLRTRPTPPSATIATEPQWAVAVTLIHNGRP